jgi:hypothetical protein
MSRIPATVTRKVERTTTSTRRFNPQANSTAINPRVTTASTSSISLSRVSRGSAADRTRIGTARPSQAPPPVSTPQPAQNPPNRVAGTVELAKKSLQTSARQDDAAAR